MRDPGSPSCATRRAVTLDWWLLASLGAGLITSCSSEPDAGRVGVVGNAALSAPDTRMVRRRDELPPEIRSLIAPIADPGEPYNDSDAIKDPGYPNRQLLFGGIREESAFVFFDVGEFLSHRTVILFAKHDGSFIPERSYLFARRVETRDDIIRAIDSGRWVATYEGYRKR